MAHARLQGPRVTLACRAACTQAASIHVLNCRPLSIQGLFHTCACSAIRDGSGHCWRGLIFSFPGVRRLGRAGEGRERAGAARGEGGQRIKAASRPGRGSGVIEQGAQLRCP